MIVSHLTRRGRVTGIAAALVAAVFLVPSLAAAQGAMNFPPPIVKGTLVKLSKHTWVLPDGDVTLVPNIGVVVGKKAVLVIDTGMGNPNAKTALAEVAKVGGRKPIYLMTTHTHPEHSAGMAAFPAGTQFVAARVQQDEYAAMGATPFAGMAKLTPEIGEMLKGAALLTPAIVFEAEHVLDLGGVKVRLIWMGPAHSKGDTVAVVEGEGVVFAGDLAPRGRFPSFSGVSTRANFETAMGRVEALKGTVIVPSHGPYGDNSIFPDLRNAIDQTAARVTALKAQGQPVGDVVKALVPEIEKLYPRWKNTIPNNVEPMVRALYADAR